MTPGHRSVVRHVKTAGLAAMLLVAAAVPASAQSTTITIPGAEVFIVRNTAVSTTGTTTMTITWSITGSFSGGNHLRISVKSDAANFTPPSAGRSPIAATKASWTIASATNGTGSAGTINSSTYTAVYNSSNGKKNGTVVLNWTLASVGTNLHSGNHQLALRWKLESVP